LRGFVSQPRISNECLFPLGRKQAREERGGCGGVGGTKKGGKREGEGNTSNGRTARGHHRVTILSLLRLRISNSERDCIPLTYHLHDEKFGRIPAPPPRVKRAMPWKTSECVMDEEKLRLCLAMGTSCLGTHMIFVMNFRASPSLHLCQITALIRNGFVFFLKLWLRRYRGGRGSSRVLAGRLTQSRCRNRH